MGVDKLRLNINFLSYFALNSTEACIYPMEDIFVKDNFENFYTNFFKVIDEIF